MYLSVAQVIRKILKILFTQVNILSPSLYFIFPPLQLTQFSLDWVNCLPVLRKLSLTEIGCVFVEVPRHFRGVLEGGAGRHNNLSHVTLNYPTDLPESAVLARIMSHLTCFEVFSFLFFK